jgi:hypothetical protein
VLLDLVDGVHDELVELVAARTVQRDADRRQVPAHATAAAIPATGGPFRAPHTRSLRSGRARDTRADRAPDPVWADTVRSCDARAALHADLTAVVGPLASYAEPHSYDLCEEHAVRLTAPRGWEVLRHVGEFPAPIPHADDLEALADAVREAARVEPGHPLETSSQGRRGHLRVVPGPRLEA